MLGLSLGVFPRRVKPLKGEDQMGELLGARHGEEVLLHLPPGGPLPRHPGEGEGPRLLLEEALAPQAEVAPPRRFSP